jgi:phospholipid/cholesterol/gamma-HCH transport system ATP-binding protein
MTSTPTPATRLRTCIGNAVQHPLPQVRRLLNADTTVAFAVGRAQPFTLRLDGAAPEVRTDGVEAAAVHIELTDEQADAVSSGASSIALIAAAGELASRGPLRNYLEVDPTLRWLLSGATGLDDAPTLGGARTSAGSGEPPAESLAIETRGVHKRFGSHQVLAGVDLTIPEGLISVILGPSGTGKSVLLQNIVGLMRPDEGEVFVRQRAIAGLSRVELDTLRRDVGVMFQDGALFSSMTVFDNVAFPLRQHSEFTEREIHEIVSEQLDAVGLANAAAAMPASLSGGMRKRAGLARALVLDPGIVVCDEPDSGLDPVRTALLAELLRERHSEGGGTMIVVTHNIELARQLGDYVAVLWDGKILESGIGAAMFDSALPFVRQFLTGETVGPLGMDSIVQKDVPTSASQP